MVPGGRVYHGGEGMAGKTWNDNRGSEQLGHLVFTSKKQMTISSQLAVSSLYRSGSYPREWCHPQWMSLSTSTEKTKTCPRYNLIETIPDRDTFPT